MKKELLKDLKDLIEMIERHEQPKGQEQSDEERTKFSDEELKNVEEIRKSAMFEFVASRDGRAIMKAEASPKEIIAISITFHESVLSKLDALSGLLYKAQLMTLLKDK